MTIDEMIDGHSVDSWDGPEPCECSACGEVFSRASGHKCANERRFLQRRMGKVKTRSSGGGLQSHETWLTTVQRDFRGNPIGTYETHYFGRARGADRRHK